MAWEERDGPAIGIDLGTSNARVGVWRHGRMKIIPNERGSRATPSYIAFSHTQRFVGEHGDIDPANTFFEMEKPRCCDKSDVSRGLWTAEDDAKLLAYISTHGTKDWTSVPMKAGLKRCGKSCMLRWTNYLMPNLKDESFTPQEEELIVRLHTTIGSRWSIIALQLPGRRNDNDVKNYWNTKLRKKLFRLGINPITHRPITDILQSIGTPHDARISTLDRDMRSLYHHNPTLNPSPQMPAAVPFSPPAGASPIHDEAHMLRMHSTLVIKSMVALVRTRHGSSARARL